MIDQFRFLFQFFFRPWQAASGVLDRGSFAFGAVAAGLLALGLGSLSMANYGIELGRMMAGQPDIGAMVASKGDATELAQQAAQRREWARAYQEADAQITRRYFSVGFKGLLSMAVVFVFADSQHQLILSGCACSISLAPGLEFSDRISQSISSG